MNEKAEYNQCFILVTKNSDESVKVVISLERYVTHSLQNQHSFASRENSFSTLIINNMENTMTMNEDIVAIATTDCKTLAAAVKAAGLVATLQGKGPFTVFAPSDAAFASIQSEVDNLLKPENKAKLSKILTYHVVSGKMKAADLKDGQELTTVEGSKLKVMIKDGTVFIGNAKVSAADINASNGVIHVIDKVLLPKD